MELGWIDFSQKDRQKALDMMALLQEQGAVDELGIGIVRDAFANVFFPGTSTIQTRAKYFLIVPYSLRDAVDGRYGRNVDSILKKIDEDEKECGKQLMKNSPGEDGIIGSRVLPDEWVARTPSDIYWNGIRTYRIFQDDSLSIREYVSLCSREKNEKARMNAGNRADESGDADRDDKDAGDFGALTFWNLPVYSKDWREHLQIGLTRTEAEFLKKQMTETMGTSLLSFILKNHVDVDRCDDFECLTELLEPDLDRHMADLMRLACGFSNLVYLARTRYNLILSEGANKEAIRAWDKLEGEILRKASVDLDAVFSELRINDPQKKTFLFLKAIQKCFLEKRYEDADTRIREREIFLKGPARAKLNRPKEYDPQNWVGGRRLDYRYSDAKRIIQDIYAGEESENV